MAATVTVDSQNHTNGQLKRYGSLNVGVYVNPGGVAVTANQFRLGAGDFELFLQPSGGYVPEYIRSTKKIIVRLRGSHTHALHFNNADVADGASARVNVGTNLMGANTGTDVAVAGVQDTTGAGGVVASAAEVLGEVANAVDLSAISFRFEASGAF